MEMILSQNTCILTVQLVIVPRVLKDGYVLLEVNKF